MTASELLNCLGSRPRSAGSDRDADDKDLRVADPIVKDECTYQKQAAFLRAVSKRQKREMS